MSKASRRKAQDEAYVLGTRVAIPGGEARFVGWVGTGRVMAKVLKDNGAMTSVAATVLDEMNGVAG